ncbi:hypothetical protein HYQ46_003030 [Verticillium longisporum]|nr:hypothetical protein HYQ44_014698 [Verticillium longisporum]KAG7148101.1 hypothetical protein HYQ46_003030 [Verticillium longisporum]
MSQESYRKRNDRMPVQGTLPTRATSPDRLLRALRNKLGPGGFAVEVRHDMYNIRAASPLEISCDGHNPIIG